MSEIYYNASNLIVSNGFVRNPERYYIEEYFLQKPELKGVLGKKLTNPDASHTDNEAIQLASMAANKNFECSNDKVTFNTNCPGIIVKTGSSSTNKAIIEPHSNSNQTILKQGFLTQNKIEWECALKIDSTTDVKVWAGLKKTNAQLMATDTDQAFFKYQRDDTNGDGISDSLNLHFIYSIGNKDYSTDLGININSSTIYRLKIVINKAKEVTVFVNEKQYSLTIQEFTTKGLTESNINQKSLPLTDGALLPIIGVETGTNSEKTIKIYYQKISVELS